MSNKIFTFVDEKNGFHARTRYIDGECWFVGKDVAQSLGYVNTKDALVKHVFPDYKRVLNAKTIQQMASQHKGCDSRPLEFDTTSPRGLLYIKEAGVYQLIFSSKLSKAIEFQRWVFEEVLPALRREGQYNMLHEQARFGGKITRRNLTDILTDLFNYAAARDEFHHDKTFLFQNYSKLVNRVVGIATGDRDNLTAKQLFELDTCENICTKTIARGMSNNLSQHDIYEACKAKLDAWQKLIND